MSYSDNISICFYFANCSPCFFLGFLGSALFESDSEKVSILLEFSEAEVCADCATPSIIGASGEGGTLFGISTIGSSIT
jgi:hypothetical protein